MISVISCLLTAVSVESVYLYHGDADINVTMDPLRLAAQIVSGIGFLGAGVILHRANDTVSGLTTAAMSWGAAGMYWYYCRCWLLCGGTCRCNPYYPGCRNAACCSSVCRSKPPPGERPVH
nr:MgtC/SapB family protein [Domibacillus sp.]